MDQNAAFWHEEVHFGPFRSANCTLATLVQANFRADIEESRKCRFKFRVFSGNCAQQKGNFFWLSASDSKPEIWRLTQIIDFNTF